MDSDVQICESCHSDGGRYVGCIDVVMGPTGRRGWPEHVKASIVLETYRDGVSVADIARKHDISPPAVTCLAPRRPQVSVADAGQGWDGVPAGVCLERRRRGP